MLTTTQIEHYKRDGYVVLPGSKNTFTTQDQLRPVNMPTRGVLHG